MSIGIATLLVGSATFAYFDDTETSTGNTFTAGIIDLGFVGPGACYLAISFLYEDSFLGVDDDTSGWSSDDTMKNLGTGHINLLGYTADANAWENSNAATFTHRGTRGLGVLGGSDDDEVDNINMDESIVITFDTPQWLNGFEVRSLFAKDGIDIIDEEGQVDWYLGGSPVGGYHLIGEEQGGNGVLNVQFDPVLVDEIVFYVPSGQSYTDESEFAVAQIYLANECMQDDDFNGLGLGIWTLDDMKPGENDCGIIVFNELGTNRGGTLDIACTYTADEDDDGNSGNGLNDGPESDTDWTTGDDQTTTDAFAGFMQITEMNYHSNPNTDLLPSITDHNGNTWIDLYDLKQSTLSVPLSDNGADGDYLEMTVYFHYTAGNDYQGDIIELTMIFTLEQIMYP